MKPMHLLAKTSLLLGAMLYITSCNEMQPENELAPASESVVSKSEPEVAYPGESGTLKKGKLFGTEITYSEIDGKAVFQGDIILSPGQLAEGNNARTEATGKYRKVDLWANGVIYYTIDASITNTDAILAAIAEVEAATPINFVPRRGLPVINDQLIRSSYVTFKLARGYSSSIGRIGGEQFITVPVTHTKGGVLHEIGHTVGLFHEHNRTDRAETIKVNLANVADAHVPSIYTYTGQGYFGYDYGTMDLGSIMLMDSYAYSKNGLPTMTLLNGSTFPAQRTHLSQDDISGITLMYSDVFALTATTLFGGDAAKGNKALTGTNWGNAEVMCATTNDLYIFHAGSLWWVDRITGKRIPLINGLSGVKGMVFYKDNLYFIQNGYLYKYNPTTTVGTKGTGQYWLPTTALAYCYGFLFIVSGDTMFRVAPEGQTFISMGSGFKGVTEITSLKKNIYFLKQGKLWQMDWNTGAVVQHSTSTFAADAQLTANTKNLLITTGGMLYSVDETGVTKTVSNKWSGVLHLSAAGTEDWK
jgi:hypothetical protein